jgi:hypothetical protein
MAHFAKLDNNNVVIAVHCVVNEVLDENNEEVSGRNFLTALHNYPFWVQTSYNNNIRKQYAGIGYTYDAVNDVFIAPQPYLSWTLDNDFNWQPPTPMPIDGVWYWNEVNQVWVNANKL